MPKSDFPTKPTALFMIAQHLAGSMEAGGMDNTLDGMGILLDNLTDAEIRRVEWAMMEVARRLRKMGKAPEE